VNTADLPLRIKTWAQAHIWAVGGCALFFCLALAGYALWRRPQVPLAEDSLITAPPAGEVEMEKIPVLSENEWLRAGVPDTSENKISVKIQAADAYDGLLIMVNASQPLPDGFVPANLVNISETVQAMRIPNVSSTKNTMTVRQEIMGDLARMLSDAAQQDLGWFYIVSAYRDKAYQEVLYNRKVSAYALGGMSQEQAETAAKTVVVYPGTSEHQTGLTLDICDNTASLTHRYADTEQGQWLARSAWKYGFILRYPEDKRDVTGIIFEPWHIRFVGQPHAEIMARSNWVLEEYIQTLRSTGGIRARTENGKVWQISYYDAARGAVQVPRDKPWQMSGDGQGGVIVTVEGAEP
jgi:D-alanyl-D-alanine carboxypeptidase